MASHLEVFRRLYLKIWWCFSPWWGYQNTVGCWCGQEGPAWHAVGDPWVAFSHNTSDLHLPSLQSMASAAMWNALGGLRNGGPGSQLGVWVLIPHLSLMSKHSEQDHCASVSSPVRWGYGFPSYKELCKDGMRSCRWRSLKCCNFWAHARGHKYLPTNTHIWSQYSWLIPEAAYPWPCGVIRESVGKLSQGPPIPNAKSPN